MQKIEYYIRLTRPHWTIASTLASTVGILHALYDGIYNPILALLVLVGAFSLHAFMEVWDELNDYINYRKEVYEEATQPATLFSGGSGVLAGKLLSINQVWNMFYFLGFINLIILFSVIYFSGFQFLICVFVGLLFLFGYGSIIKMSYIGLGEFANFISFGPILILSSYVVMKLSVKDTLFNNINISLNLFLISVLLGLFWFASTHVSGMQDYEEDKMGNKRTLVVRFGKQYASRVPLVCGIVFLCICVYLLTTNVYYAVPIPVLIWNVYESYKFMINWIDKGYFLKKLKSFFIYRNFILTGYSFVISYSLMIINKENFLNILMISIFSSLPAFYFLFRSRE